MPPRHGRGGARSALLCCVGSIHPYPANEAFNCPVRREQRCPHTPPSISAPRRSRTTPPCARTVSGSGDGSTPLSDGDVDCHANVFTDSGDAGGALTPVAAPQTSSLDATRSRPSPLGARKTSVLFTRATLPVCSLWARLPRACHRGRHGRRPRDAPPE